VIHPAKLKKQRTILFLLAILIILTLFIGLGWGYSSLSYNRIFPVLFGQGTLKEEFVLYSIRLPRSLITLLAGMALAVSGAILQGISRNDLADPGIMGINAGAGVALSICFLYLPLDPGTFTYALPLIAFIGALVIALLIYLCSYQRDTGFQPVRLILIGVGFSLALSGAMMVIISSAEREKVDFIARWLAGNIWGTDWPFVWAILPWFVTLIPFAFYKANRLNVLAMDEPVAIGLGLAINKERFAFLCIAVALAASAVAVTGGISFIGLMAPHLAKALIGPRVQLFMPVAMLLGGWLLLVADTIGRNLTDPDGLPAGIMVALIGAPYFIYLLLGKSK
jgi:iron complex transport system permease protein